MWQHNYEPLGGSLALSTLVAVVPVLVLFFLLGVMRKPAWVAAVSALGSALVVAILAYGMPVQMAITSTLFGAAFGLMPIAWIVFTAILLYRLTVETGKFEIIKDSVGGLTTDRRLQALLIAFAFGAFIEGAAGFGSPVAISGAMLAGLGFPPFYAAALCLLANTAPVAFGSLGIPVITLANITGLPVLPVSAMVGRLSAMMSLFIPGYLMLVMAGPRGALQVLPAIVVCGVAFAGAQFAVSNFMGPELTDILSSLAGIGAMILVIKFWKPKTNFRLEDDVPLAHAAGAVGSTGMGGEPTVTLPKHHTGREVFMAWTPYLLLVVFVMAWGFPPIKAAIDQATTIAIPVPGLHNMITRMPPVTAEATPYAAIYNFNWLSAAGTATLLASFLAALVLGVGPRRYMGVVADTFQQLKFPILTIASMLGLAYLMNYSGMTTTLGLALATTGVLFPFFSAILGWLGVFLTGSDTSANALFGNLQVVTANTLGLDPLLTASVNSSAGVMGKMISLQSIAVAVAATGMVAADESRLFRFTIKHSIFLVTIMGIVSMLIAYVFPGFVPDMPPPAP